jgi:CheY-like chemotaxis protein
MKVLLVDDDEDLVNSTRIMLEPEGIQLIPALSGWECLDILREERPDYILLDIDMPGMDGWKTLQEIKKNKELRKIPVAMLTAKTLNPEVLDRKEMDLLVDYISKPFTKRDVLETIHQVYD